MARYDFGMTLAEFGRTTPGMFAELMKRQGARFRRECYLAGITASTVANVNRPNEKAKVYGPFDFVPESEKRADKREELRKEIMAVFGAMMEFRTTPEAIDRARDRIVERLKVSRADVEEVFAEAFPGWEKRQS